MVYPSIGNRDYPYNSWKQKRPEYAWKYLENLAYNYNEVCRVLRKRYKWSPLVCDKIQFHRLLQIIEEPEENNGGGNEDLDD